MNMNEPDLPSFELFGEREDPASQLHGEGTQTIDLSNLFADYVRPLERLISEPQVLLLSAGYWTLFRFLRYSLTGFIR